MGDAIGIIGLSLAAVAAFVLMLFFGKSANVYMRQVNNRTLQQNVTPQDLIESVEPPSQNVEPPRSSWPTASQKHVAPV